jgi:hypothetical protein
MLGAFNASSYAITYLTKSATQSEKYDEFSHREVKMLHVKPHLHASAPQILHEPP